MPPFQLYGGVAFSLCFVYLCPYFHPHFHNVDDGGERLQRGVLFMRIADACTYGSCIIDAGGRIIEQTLRKERKELKSCKFVVIFGRNLYICSVQ